MKKLVLASGTVALLVVATVGVSRLEGPATGGTSAVAAVAAALRAPVAEASPTLQFWAGQVEVTELAKRCSFQSDCRYGRCKQGRCGSCSFQSDCRGWGRCEKGYCGRCSFQSDCKAWGGCKSGRCARSPY